MAAKAIHCQYLCFHRGFIRDSYFLRNKMVRNYVRKTTRQTWDAQSMQLALVDISNGMPFKTAARMYKLPLMTLKRRAKNQNKVVSALT